MVSVPYYIFRDSYGSGMGNSMHKGSHDWGPPENPNVFFSSEVLQGGLQADCYK